MQKYLTEYGKNCWMSDYRETMHRAARMVRIANQGNLSFTDTTFLATEAMELFRAAQRCKAEILLFDSYKSPPLVVAVTERGQSG